MYSMHGRYKCVCNESAKSNMYYTGRKGKQKWRKKDEVALLYIYMGQ